MKLDDAQHVHRPCWCGASNARTLGTFDLPGQRQFPLVECIGCRVQAIYPQPDDSTLLSYYSNEYYGGSPRKFVWPFSQLMNWFAGHRAAYIKHLLRPPARVLDVGCGNGRFLMHMKQRGFEVEGTEWTAESAARVSASENIPVHVGDLLSLQLHPQSYDLVTIWHVLEHLRQPHESLLRIRELLKPNGFLLLAVPNVESAQAKRFGLHWLHYDPPRHLFDFGTNSLSSLLELSGFAIDERHTWSMDQNVFGHIQSWLNARGKPRDRLYASLKHTPGQQRKVGDLLWMMLLLVPAMVTSIRDARRGEGATLIVIARPQPR